MTDRGPRRPGPVGTLAVVALTAVAGCTAPVNGPTFPPQGATAPPAGDATLVVQARVVDALAEAGLQAGPSVRPYRPPEAARLAAAPRTVLQVTLPEDPQRGLLVLYALGTPEAALAGAREQAAYIASGPGRVQFPPDSRFVLRVSGPVVLFYAWSPGSAVDPRTADIEPALASIGAEVPVGG